MNLNSIKRLFKYMANYKFILIIVTICIFISSLVGILSSVFLQSLIDDFIAPLLVMETVDYSNLLQMLIFMSAVYVIGSFATWAYNVLMVTVAQKTLKDVRDDMFGKMQTFPISYFDQNTNGDIMSHYTNDTDTLRQMLAQSLPQIMLSIVTIVGLFITMLIQSIYLTLVTVVGVVVIRLTVSYISKKIGHYFQEQQASLGDLNGFIEEMINGQKVIKVFNHEQQAIDDFNQKNQIWRQAATAANGNANTIMPIMNGLGYLQYVVIALLGSVLAINSVTNITIVGTNVVTVGLIASFLAISRNFTMTIAGVANQYNSIVTALAGAERIFELIDIEPETDEGYVTLTKGTLIDGHFSENSDGDFMWKHPHSDQSVEYIPVKGDIVLDEIDFGYTDKQILHQISVFAKPGEKIAFVGATGAGKTTITNLINRFYDIADGKIRYDGININKIKKQDLRKSLGIVLQDVNLFTGTVLENIRYGNEKATDEECINAAKLANAHSFIEMLPSGYETILEGNASGLSQGQRQLISIARAAVSNPPAMILDEATSSIDTRTEKLVQSGMDKLMEGRTVFVIAHRLSTIMNSDVIMVLDQGRIIERGNHQDLMSLKGTYYDLQTGVLEID